MTAEEYAAAKQAIRSYEELITQREKYKRIKDTADTLVIRDDVGSEIELIGSEPLAALGTYVDEKIATIDIQLRDITISAVQAK